MSETFKVAAHQLSLDLNNFHLLHYRHIDGFLVSGKNSGTHWLKYMLSHALAAKLGLPPPLHASGRTANDFVGHPKWPQKYEQAPRLGSSHNLPSSLLGWRPVFNALKLPPIVVLVRDIREAMLSNYIKWRATSGLTLSDYVRAPAPGRPRVADIWWYIDFFNRWGRLATHYPHKVVVVRYEDLVADQRHWLQFILDHYEISMPRTAIEEAVRASRRERMRARLDPNAGELIIPADAERNDAGFSEADLAILSERLGRHLKYRFGYDLVGTGRDRPKRLQSPKSRASQP